MLRWKNLSLTLNILDDMLKDLVLELQTSWMLRCKTLYTLSFQSPLNATV